MWELIAKVGAMTCAIALLVETCAFDSAGGRDTPTADGGFVTGYASFDSHWEDSHLGGYSILTQEPGGEDPRPIREEFTLTHEFALKDLMGSVNLFIPAPQTFWPLQRSRVRVQVPL